MTRSTRNRLLLLVCTIIAALATAELAIAIFWPQETFHRLLMHYPRIFSPSDLLPYALTPNSTGTLITPEFESPITINAHGHRSEPFDLEKSERFRILAIGDSFTFGYGGPAAESYPSVIAEHLRDQLHTGAIEVINAGFAACYYPDTYYLYLKEIGLGLDPDLILIGFFIGNDFDHEGAYENHWVRVDGNGFPLKIECAHSVVENGYLLAKQKRRRYRLPVLRNSHLAQALARALTSFRPEPPMYFNHWIYRKNYLERTNTIVQKIQRLLVGISDLARGRQIPLVVVMIPAREQIYPAQYPFEDYAYMKDCDLEKPQRIFARFFKQEGIEYLDLLPLLKQEPTDQPLYYPLDAHWNRRGNEVAGRAIAEFLLERSLLKASQSVPTNAAE